MNMEELKIQENGESDVQVATIGTVIGSDKDGNPVEQNFSEEALKMIAETQKDEILVDADHSSERSESTEAKGWLSGLKFVPGAGLFGKIKWTDIGKKLIQNRVFRWLSPAWLLNDNKEPMLMTSCALTNKPAQYGRIQPIINQIPAQEKEEKETVKMEMTREELISLIKEVALNAQPEKQEPKKEDETKKEEVRPEEMADKPADEKSPGEKLAEELEKEEEQAKQEEKKPAENEQADQKADTAKCEEPEKKEEEPEKKEVIKPEALNSTPVSVGTSVKSLDKWRELHGKDFFDYLRAHPELH